MVMDPIRKNSSCLFSWTYNQSNMNIENNKDWCCCQQSSLQQQHLQESISQQYLSRKSHPLTPNSLSPTPQHPSPLKHVFNFRQNRCRLVSPSRPSPHLSNIQRPVASQMTRVLVNLPQSGPNKQSRKDLILEIEACSNPINFKRSQFCVRDERSRSIRVYFSPETHSSVVRPVSPRIKFTLENPPIGKMQGKRLKTAEEQTEYSSKHSQIHFKNTNQYCENSYLFNRNSLGQSQKPVISQEEAASDAFQSLQQFPSCREVSAHEEVDHEFSNQLFQNARTMQTIVTSTARCSRQPSRAWNLGASHFEVGQDSPVNSQKTSAFPSINDIAHKSQLHSLYQSPKTNARKQITKDLQLNLSPSFIEQRPCSPKTQSNMFYADDFSRSYSKIPNISVLHIEEKDNSQEEELRDKIDNQFLRSEYPSKDISPFISINESLKNVDDRRSANFQFSPIHSRETSKVGAVGNFKKTLSQLKRTNTIQSLDSSASEHSYLDMKFIQKMRSRRGVSKLV